MTRHKGCARVPAAPHVSYAGTVLRLLGDYSKPRTWKLRYLLFDGAVDTKRLPKAIEAILSSGRSVKVSGIPMRRFPPFFNYWRELPGRRGTCRPDLQAPCGRAGAAWAIGVTGRAPWRRQAADFNRCPPVCSPFERSDSRGRRRGDREENKGK